MTKDEGWTIFNNKIPFGLLEPCQQDAFTKWEGRVTVYASSDFWNEIRSHEFYSANTYRAVQPVCVSDDWISVEEQTSKVAKEQLWELLGVENQTEAVQRIKRLLYMRKSLEVLTNGSL